AVGSRRATVRAASADAGSFTDRDGCSGEPKNTKIFLPTLATGWPSQGWSSHASGRPRAKACTASRASAPTVTGSTSPTHPHRSALTDSPDGVGEEVAEGGVAV